MHGFGGRGNFNEAVKQFLDSEGVERGAEEYRGYEAFTIFLNVEFGIDALNEFKVITEFSGIGGAYSFIDGGIIDIGNFNSLADFLLVRSEEVKGVFIDVIDTLELGAYVDWP